MRWHTSKLEVWDEDDKNQNSSDTDPLGHAVVPWEKLWSNGALTLPLTGKGSKDGSQVNVQLATTAATGENLGDAGRALLAATIGGPGVGNAGGAASEAAPIPVRIGK